MNKIILNETYFITTDRYNYVLNKMCNIKDKKTKEIVRSGEKEIAYYSNLYDCVKGFIKYSEKDIVDTFNGTIDELIKKLNKHNEEVSTLSIKIEKIIKDKEDQE